MGGDRAAPPPPRAQASAARAGGQLEMIEAARQPFPLTGEHRQTEQGQQPARPGDEQQHDTSAAEQHANGDPRDRRGARCPVLNTPMVGTKTVAWTSRSEMPPIRLERLYEVGHVSSAGAQRRSNRWRTHCDRLPVPIACQPDAVVGEGETAGPERPSAGLTARAAATLAAGDPLHW